MSWLPLLPLIIPLISAVISLLTWLQPVAWHRVISTLGSGALLVAAVALLMVVWQDGIQSVQLADWRAPFGITIVADLFSAIMVLTTAIIAFAVILFSPGTLDMRRESFEYYPLMQALVTGICGTLLTGDLFNLYVWIEVTLIASFVLMALGGELHQMEGALKYVVLNLVSSALLLMTIGVIYGITGTLNMADIAVKLETSSESGIALVLAMMLLVSFGIKAAAFPLFFWLPASYHTPPIAIIVIFAGLLTKIGVYALVRVFTLMFTFDTEITHSLILVIAGLTMVTGVLGAVAQYDTRRLLSFHIISQIGYLLMGLGIFTKSALAAMIFFMVHVILAKSALFMVSGYVNRIAGSYDLHRLGDLYRTRPGAAILFLIPALSLAGLPPFPGFFAKYALIRAGLERDQYFIIGTAIVVSVLTLYSMIKIWNEAFWKPAPEPIRAQEGPATLLVPTIAVIVIIVALGIGAGPMFELSNAAAEQLLDRTQYIEATLGEMP
ncbi:Na+/H+ antiporter subunit D [soil metagenome]